MEIEKSNASLSENILDELLNKSIENTLKEVSGSKLYLHSLRNEIIIIQTY